MILRVQNSWHLEPAGFGLGGARECLILAQYVTDDVVTINIGQRNWVGGWHDVVGSHLLHLGDRVEDLIDFPDIRSSSSLLRCK